MTKQQAVENVMNSTGSLFTKEDVLNILQSIQEEQKSESLATAHKEAIEKFYEYLKSEDDYLQVNGYDAMDYSLTMSGHEVELETVDIYKSTIIEFCENYVESYIDKLEETEDQEA